MSRTLDEAHYLHRRRGLSLLVRPPVRHATHLAWDGQGYLLVTTREGTVQRVHPAMGTQLLLQGLAEPTGIGVGDDRFVVVEADGGWAAYDLTGEPIIEGRHPFHGDVDVQFKEGKVLLSGQVGADRQMLFYDSGRKVLRIQLPPRAVGFLIDGHLGLAQSTPSGLEIIYLSSGGRFAGRELTPHVLHAFHPHLLGVHAGGVRVWRHVEGPSVASVDVALPGAVTATVSRDGQIVAVGTVDGAVALVALHAEEARARPVVVEATDVPIRSIAFSRKGRYLATGADSLILWTWE